jgi:hypothetical protein
MHFLDGAFHARAAQRCLAHYRKEHEHTTRVAGSADEARGRAATSTII